MDAPQARSNSQAVVTLVDDFVSILKAGCAMAMTNHRSGAVDGDGNSGKRGGSSLSQWNSGHLHAQMARGRRK
ncbi:hypothetical protein, partial [Mesorhizobium sp. M1E.F.Ca.ET.063.01.1.1]|uniref:hypothetical protein n=1 Tax=Mesorhizobium sp. M1E.F.Ca.ET.063.01.1.1 TaxID=2496750 RepID=UPI001AEC8F2F